MHFVVVVLLFGTASGTVDYKGRATVKDVLDFFRIGQPIALIRRSYSRYIDEFEPRCIQTIVTKNENTSLWFNQSYIYGRKRVEETMIAHVLKKPGLDSAPVMIVERAKDSENERLLRNGAKQSRNGHTHMFSRAPEHNNSIGYTKCELHVWLTGGSGVYHNCLLEYDYLCGHRKYYNLYNYHDCKF
ncbi:uncharacterized protein LOC119396064 isoform X2 [Rhipicephalus sanguineus]|uniref:uncharacterized protein LOC119396064 isoform X2 n=1 Tax=Rhipicephalus sanguineus TaxID=34632 RepID=UPI001895E612|nr:uncharacterized protein LOC119396064 isoform X2 [Rhipicephalus sanguineus]